MFSKILFSAVALISTTFGIRENPDTVTVAIDINVPFGSKTTAAGSGDVALTVDGK